MNIDTINFDQDNFAQRRASQSGAGVAYDPDSLLTGAEIAAGFDYDNSTRVPHFPTAYEHAVAGNLDTSGVLTYLPRTLKPGHALNTVEAEPAAGRWNWYEGE